MEFEDEEEYEEQIRDLPQEMFDHNNISPVMIGEINFQTNDLNRTLEGKRHTKFIISIIN
ncbi:MAG: hypothetical protein IPK55_15430 [Streptococcus sp.]|nr:hypothetical protein [Streptococcus sp.]